jgi:hypothetical protein
MNIAAKSGFCFSEKTMKKIAFLTVFYIIMLVILSAQSRADIVRYEQDDLALYKSQAIYSNAIDITASDVSHPAAFGLGTSPDSTLMFIPEPSTLIVLAVGSLVFKIKRK